MGVFDAQSYKDYYNRAQERVKEQGSYGAVYPLTGLKGSDLYTEQPIPADIQNKYRTNIEANMAGLRSDINIAKERGDTELRDELTRQYFDEKTRLGTLGDISKHDYPTTAFQGAFRGIPFGNEVMAQVGALRNQAVGDQTTRADQYDMLKELQNQQAQQNPSGGEQGLLGSIGAGGAIMRGTNALLPPVARSLQGSRILGPTVYGAEYGALHGAGQDIPEGSPQTDRAKNALIGGMGGGIGGGLLGSALAGLGNIGRNITDRFTKMTPALQEVARAQQKMEMPQAQALANFDAVNSATQGNATLADVSSSAARKAYAAAQMSPKYGNIATEFYKNRVEQLHQNAKDLLAQHTNVNPGTVTTVAETIAQKEANAKPFYDQADQVLIKLDSEGMNILRNMKKSQYDERLNMLKLQERFTNIKLPEYKDLKAGTTIPLPLLDGLKRSFQSFRPTASVADNNTYGEFGKRIRDYTIKNSGGETGQYAQALRESGDYLKLQEAEKIGLDIYKTTIPEIRAFFRNKPTADEIKAFQSGGYQATASKIDAVNLNNDPSAALIGKQELRDKLGFLIGDKAKTSEITGMIEALKTAATTRNDILSGSQTAGRQVAIQELKQAAGTPFLKNIISQNYGAAAREALGIKGGLTMKEIKVATDVGEIFSRTGNAGRDTLNQVYEYIKKLEGRDKTFGLQLVSAITPTYALNNGTKENR